MSWLVEHRKKNDKYRLWTTISDGWLTDWLTRNQMIEAIAEYWRENTEEKIKELKATFPNGWSSKRTRYRHIFVRDKRYKTKADYLEKLLREEK